MSDSSRQTEKTKAFFEVLEGKNSKGWTVELKASEIKDKETSEYLFHLFEKIYKTLSLPIDSSNEKVTTE